MSEYALEARNINKSFSGVQVLTDAHLEIKQGELHALMGENGAGKSTLIKIITGVYSKDSGSIYINGEPVKIESRLDSERNGVAVVFQELSLIPTLSVAENIYLGREPLNKLKLVNHRKLVKQADALIKQYSFPLNAADTVESLSIASRQLVEILKALSTDASLVIMDEPTASLNAQESERFFEIIESLKEKGVSILYISHRLEEVYRLADRLTILRDGFNVKTLEKAEIIPEEVIRLMIGKSIDVREESGNLRISKKEIGLEVKNLTAKGRLSDVSFSVHRGEILGIGGLVGSGRTELLRCLFGVDPFDSGEIILDGKSYRPSISKSLKQGIGLIPEDRRTQGFIPILSQTRNIALTSYDHLAKAGFVANRKEKQTAVGAVGKLDIRPANPDMKVINMSGGNQQKVVLAKWLIRDLKLLLVDEPTAGIDVGAKDEIYNHLNQLAESGVMIILVSSDLPELIKLSHRVIILRRGAKVMTFDTGSISETDVLSASSGIIQTEVRNEQQ